MLTARELKERIENNDNRCTAQPYLLLLRERLKLSCDPDYGCDGHEYIEQVSGDYASFKTLEEAKQWLGEDDPDYEFKDSDVVKWNYQEVDETVNVFLTDKGVEEHYGVNRHNLRRPNTYGIHAFRNEEIESLYGLIDRCIELEEQLAELKEQSRNAVNTTWRFINAYKGNNSVPIKGALISAESHLRKIDWIFEEKEGE